MRLLFLLLQVVSVTAHAELVYPKSWSIGSNCSGLGNAGSGTFTFSNENLVGSSGQCQKLANTGGRFTKFILGPYSGDGVPRATTQIGVNTGDVLILPPFLASPLEVYPIYSVKTKKPV